MSRLLVVTPRFPYPVIGGDRLRIFQVCKALAAEHELTLLSLCETPAELALPVPHDGVFARVERILLPKWRSWLNCALALPGREPLQVAYYRHAGFRARAAQLLREHDGALAHLVRAGAAIAQIEGVKFLEMTDAISLNYERIRATRHGSGDWRARVFAFESRRLRTYEQSIVDCFDHAFLVSDVDRRYLFDGQPAREARVSVVSNGVDVDALPWHWDPAARDIVFIGNMSSLQNYDAALHMASDILPAVRARRPGTLLHLVGRIDPERATRLAAIEGVRVTGEVPDVAAAAHPGGVGVCPLRLGAGVQNKVLEYMALGLPTVTTTLGLEGFDAVPGRDLLVADDAASFADAVVALLDHRERAEAIARAARAYVEHGHSWQARLQPMLDTIDLALDAAR